MSVREQAVQIIQEIPDNKMPIVLTFLQGIVLPKKNPTSEQISRVIEDLDKAREQAEREGWIPEDRFFSKYEALE